MAMKLKRPIARRKLRTAMVLGMRKREQASRGTKVEGASQHVTKCAEDVPVHQRAGVPLVKTPVRPQDWRTVEGKEIVPDLTRVPWLPDDWGQGVKTTNPISRSRPGYGGTYTVWISPQGRVFYHRPTIEEFLGRKLGPRDGFRGQLRLAQLQGKQTDESAFFKILSPQERAAMPSANKIHFCVISARRATTAEGMNDIAVLQAQFEKCKVVPTWYVDRESLQDYRKLGLKAVVGGGLTEARNKALEDAARQGKACVQISDDISRWEYREGKQSKVNTDEAANAAHAAATCHVISPVAAARFMLAKMRGTGKKERPRLAGVYPLASCARAFNGEPFTRRHFILGDFFVADGSPVRFDRSMTLKEDYDFTCAHIAKHGSVLRCNRLTVQAKHQTNAGGACSNRDKKGLEEQRNIAILFRKWPRAFRMNPKRQNEVCLHWPEHETGVGGQSQPAGAVKKGAKDAGKAVIKTTLKSKAASKLPPRLAQAVEKWRKKIVAAKWSQTEPPQHWPQGTFPDPSAWFSWLPKDWTAAVTVSAGAIVRRCFVNAEGVRKFHKTDMEAFLGKKLHNRSKARKPATIKPMSPQLEKEFPPDAVLFPGVESRAPYITKRCKQLAGKTVQAALETHSYRDTKGKPLRYQVKDLRYDLERGFLTMAGK